MSKRNEVKLIVDSKISSKKVMMFSKTYCPYCSMAKKALDQCEFSRSDYEVMEIENDANCSEIQDYLLELTGGRSVPRVFINGKFVGGGTEVSSFQKSGQLQAMLDA